ncbi:MAG: type VI secretion system accessory protein TagJ [Planctomycetota bacterium]
MNAIQHFNEGRLQDAIDQATADVKARPTDPDHRGLLADFLIFRGAHERADKHLEAVSTLSPGSVTFVALIRQLVRADEWRQQFHLEGRSPEFLDTPNERVQLQLRASIALREGDAAEAVELLARAEELRGEVACASEDGAFAELRDCDDLVAGVFEVFTSTGKYYWVPIEDVRSLEPRPIERPCDLLWRRFHMDVEGGPEGEVYMPSLYAPMPADAPDGVRLGRVTEFTDAEPVRGVGRRLFLLGDDVVSIDDLPSLRFGAAAEA